MGVMAECKTVEQAHQMLRTYELKTNSRYASYKATKNFGRNDLRNAKKVFWEDMPSALYGKIAFNGTPFVILGNKMFDCQFGKDRKEKRKAKMQMEKRSVGESAVTRKMHDTKKIDCPARCIFREICRFPTYKIKNTTPPFERGKIAADIQNKIRAGEKIVYERVIITYIASIEEHTCHTLGETIQQPIDPRLAQKIKDLCQLGVSSVDAVRSLLNSYVQDICKPLPHPSNTRFYPSNKCISNHIYKAKIKEKKEDMYKPNNREKKEDMYKPKTREKKTDQQAGADLIDEHTHPSVRIKGTETNYIPVQCFDPVCADKAPHMHCPFCVKTDTYTDPVILKAHYRVKHVDKGIEFAGLKVLRCCDRCDIVGVIKGEKKFKGAHWHCYKCRNGFNRRDEAIKHYKTHFRNPQTTFQIQIAQDINQPVTQAFETEEAAACIPTDSFSVHASLTEGVPAHSSGISMLPRGLEGMVAMPGVGAVETVGVSDTQTIMIIQDDGQGNLSAMQEFCTTQDSDPPDLTISDEIDDTSQDTVQELRDKIAQLEKEKAEQKAHIALLSKKIEEQSQQIEAYKLREQSLLEQMQELQQGMSVPQDRVIQDLCSQLETQHKELIRKQITQLKHSLVQTSVPQPKMIVLNTNALRTQLGQTVNLQAFDTNSNNATQVAVSLDFNPSAGLNEVNSGSLQTEMTEVDTNDSVEEGKVTDETEQSKEEHYAKETDYPEILVHNLPHELDGENPIIENDGNICDEPEAKKRRKEK
ncbi:uncharacterized protein LOC123534181 isoform X2 [Mercenaria mercenaria]|uniref:uncharacterized protein LOC123534181 isoform X2 n=1 Tax=Mercenaria mercenaria TaxID=6596 RepID=UPI00234E6944|nr:uncharacterized protein LOC123534181 isoform X2 [Mercenaria mercenaria]